MTVQNQLIQLNTMPELKRNHSWEKNFLDLLPQGFLTPLSSTPQMGPDGWPYLFTTLDDRSTDSSLQILQWLSERGIGLAINPGKNPPDYILTYGMIWNYRERGTFLTQSKMSLQKKLVIDGDPELQAGPPSQTYFPFYAQKVLKQFFLDQSILRPKMLMLMKKVGDEFDFQLCFSLESLGNPPANEHQGVLEMLSWFFPSHYQLVLISEKGLPAFFDLAVSSVSNSNAAL